MKVLHFLLDPALSSVLTNLTLLAQLLLPFGAVPVLYEVTSEFVSNIEINLKKLQITGFYQGISFPSQS
jgi:hypothetical protein